METYPLRLRPGQDLKGSLDELCAREGWSAAVVLIGIGSLKVAAIRFAGEEEVNLLEGDLEIVSLSGTLSVDGSHLHVSMSDDEGRVKGGHLKEGSIVRTTAEIVVGILSEWEFRREVDGETGYLELEVRKRSV
ncbi:MAG: PPC domain-containing DNA-binding protein [Verrucomicrobiota bacterium]